jgi:hypothetical protein
MHQTGRWYFVASLLVVLAIGVGLALPRFTHAQATSTAATTELSSTIRAALLSDPRAHQLSQAQIDQLVSALTKQAQEKGITVEKLQWQPKPTEAFVPPAPAPEAVTDPYSCGSFPRILCAMSAAFGFTDIGSAALPIALGVVTLIVLLALILLYEHHRHQRHIEELSSQVVVPPQPQA